MADYLGSIMNGWQAGANMAAMQEQLKSKQEEIDLKKQAAGIAKVKVLNDVLEPGQSPALRSYKLNSALEGLGIDPKSDSAKEFSKLVNGLSDQERLGAQELIKNLGVEVSPEALPQFVAMAIKNPSALLSMTEQMNKRYTLGPNDRMVDKSGKQLVGQAPVQDVKGIPMGVWNGLSKEERAAVFGIGKKQQPEFIQLMDALDSTTDPTRKKIIGDRMNAMSKGTGFALNVSPDGTVSLVQGQDAPSNTPAVLRDSITTAQSEAQQGLEQVRGVIGAINENRNRAGVPGAIQTSLQKGVGIARDLDRYLGTNLKGMIETSAGMIDKDIAKNLAPEDTLKFFDEKLPEMEVMENLLAYRLARANKGSGRLNNQDIDVWKKVINLQGATDVDTVLSRLKTVESEFQKAYDLQTKRIKAQQTGNPSQTDQQPGPVSQAVNQRATKAYRIEGDTLVPVVEE